MLRNESGLYRVWPSKCNSYGTVKQGNLQNGLYRADAGSGGPVWQRVLSSDQDYRPCDERRRSGAGREERQSRHRSPGRISKNCSGSKADWYYRSRQYPGLAGRRPDRNCLRRRRDTGTASGQPAKRRIRRDRKRSCRRTACRRGWCGSPAYFYRCSKSMPAVRYRKSDTTGWSEHGTGETVSGSRWVWSRFHGP